MIDGKNQNTFWKHDQYGRVTSKVDHAGADMFRYTYDANNRLTNRWTPEKLDAYYTYDSVGNLTFINYRTNTDITLQYDKLNRLTNMVDAVGATRYAYTGFGAVATEDGPWENDTVSYSYTSRLRSGLSVQAPNSSPWTQTYAHDAMQRLRTVTSPAGSFTYGYTRAGSLVTNIALPNGAAITNGYDSVGRLTTTMLKGSGGILNSNTYVYDLGSRRMTNARAGNVHVRYGYDNVGQLKTASAYQANSSLREHEKFGYAYDAAGNLNYRTNDALIQTFTVNNLNQLSSVARSGNLTTSGTQSSNATSVTVALNGAAAASATLWPDNTFSTAGLSLLNGSNTITAVATDGARYDTNAVTAYMPASASFVYDANGNLVYDGQKAMEYDDENQLVRLVVTNSWRSDFVYDGKMRRRIRREYTWQNSAWVVTNEVRYVYDGNLVLQERDNLNVPSVSYTRGIDLSGTFEGAGGIGGLLARTDHSTPQPSTAYYHADGNGNITTLIDINQVVLARYAYEPFGRTFSMSGPLAEANLYRFSSKEIHHASALAYYLYRYYDPSIQRWLNRDPLEENGGMNLYQFALNSPVNEYDLWGLLPPSDPKCVRILNSIAQKARILAGKRKDMLRNKKNLPQSAPGDDKYPSRSIDGHLRMIQDLENAMKRDQDWYDQNCKDPEPPSPPCPVPDPQAARNAALLLLLLWLAAQLEMVPAR